MRSMGSGLMPKWCHSQLLAELHVESCNCNSKDM